MASVSLFIRNKIKQVGSGAVPIFKTENFDDYDFRARGVTNQFLADAAKYYDRYTNPAHFKHLYSLALASITIPTSRRLRVLDIGTGGGNSLFAILDLVGDIDALGVDISAPLLGLCSAAAETQYRQRDNISLLCADLFDLDVIADSADIVSGSSILHHMIEPQRVLDIAVTALRPGGHAIFTEPFESGAGVLRGIYATIIALSERHADLDPQVAKYLANFIRDFDARKGIGEIRPYTQHLDDKWFFTRQWFETQAARLGCTCRIRSSVEHQREWFSRTFRIGLRMSGQNEDLPVPDWAMSVLRAFDETFSAAARDEIMVTGIVVLQKRDVTGR